MISVAAIDSVAPERDASVRSLKRGWGRRGALVGRRHVDGLRHPVA